MGEPPITDLGICNLYDAVLQIHMIPLEFEDFSPSHPCIDRHHKDGLQVLTGNSHKMIYLVFCQVTKPSIVLSEQLHRLGWILIEVPPLDGRIEQVLEPSQIPIHDSWSHISYPHCLEPRPTEPLAEIVPAREIQ